MKVIQSQTQEQHLKRLVNSRTRQPYADGDLQVTSVTAQTPGAGNGNKNTRLVVSAKSGGKAQGSGTFDYNRIALAAMNPLTPATVLAKNTDTHATIQNRILKQFGIPADQVSITNPGSLPPPGGTRSYLLTPNAGSLLFLPTTRSVDVKNTDAPQGYRPPELKYLLSADDQPEGTTDIRNVITDTAATRQGSIKYTNTQKKFGTGSLSLNGAGDRLIIPQAEIGDLMAGDFTIEAWVYPTSNGANRPIFAQWDQRGNGAPYTGLILWLNNGVLQAYFAPYSGSTLIAGAAVLINSWTHVAMCRSGNTLRLFINGVVVASVTVTGTLPGVTTNYTVGNYYGTTGSLPGSGVNDFAGFIDELAVWRGLARYTENFNPISLTQSVSYPQNLKFFMNAENLANGSTDLRNLITNTALTRAGDTKVSTAQTKYGAGSILLDGAGDYLTIPRAEIGNVLTGDFTMEAWVYPTSNGAWRTIVAQWSQQTGNLQYGAILMINNGTLLGYFAPYSASTALTGGAVPLNTWSHVALTRTGDTLRLFLNGAIAATATTTNVAAQLACDWTVGNFYGPNGQFPASGSTDFAGYIDQLAIWQGVSRYSAAFSPEMLAF